MAVGQLYSLRINWKMKSGITEVLLIIFKQRIMIML